MYRYDPMVGGWGWIMGLSFIVFWVLVAVAIFALVRFAGRSGQRPFPPYRGFGGGPGPSGQAGPAPGPMAGTPEQILADRFARGDIDEKEYRQRMSVLREEAGPGGPAGPPGPAAPPS